jgi:hypothetical protein
VKLPIGTAWAVPASNMAMIHPLCSRIPEVYNPGIEIALGLE